MPKAVGSNNGLGVRSIWFKVHLVFTEDQKDEMHPRPVRRPHLKHGFVCDTWILTRYNNAVEKYHGRRVHVDLTVNEYFALCKCSHHR